MSNRRPYVRPMDGWWWRSNPFFVRYMIREATGDRVVHAWSRCSAVRLRRARLRTTDGWKRAQRPLSVAFHLLVLAVFVHHTWSWFSIMPKTMPLILASGRRLSPAVVTGTGVAVSAILCVALFLLVLAMKP
jgi:fumarate reductase subunit C